LCFYCIFCFRIVYSLFHHFSHFYLILLIRHCTSRVRIICIYYPYASLVSIIWSFLTNNWFWRAPFVESSLGSAWRGCTVMSAFCCRRVFFANTQNEDFFYLLCTCKIVFVECLFFVFTLISCISAHTPS
jgi:hypothetical protein